MNVVETLEIDVSFVHDIEGPGLENHMVEKMYIVLLAACNADKRGNIASQVELSMHLDGAFVAAMLSPRKQRKAQIDDRGIQRVDRSFEIRCQRLTGIKCAGLVDQNQGDVAIDFPVAQFVGFGQSVSRYPCFHTGVIKFASGGSQTSFDVAQRLAAG